MSEIDSLLSTALSGLRLMEKAQCDVEAAEKAYAESLHLHGIAGFLVSARKLKEVKRTRDIRNINHTVTMPVYLPVFARIVKQLAAERSMTAPAVLPCTGGAR